MSPNPNYVAGRSFEYSVRDYYREGGYSVLRTAGSRGAFDLIAYRPDYPVVLIQCKKVRTEAAARRLIDAFSANPPDIPNIHYHQVLWVRVPRKPTYTVEL